jgi:hypothetical protein
MNEITVCEDVFNPTTWQKYECGDVRDFLMQYFPAWPEGAHVYHRFVAQSCDVTPYDELTTDKLGELNGSFYVVVYPNLPVWVVIVIAIVVAAVAIGIAFLLRPTASPNIKNQQASSPNNSLSDRQNSARPGERIPDIYGKVQAIPDLIASPYTVFVNSKELEICYMCVGRGNYEIASAGGHYKIYDDTTPVDEIAGTSVEVYAPGVSPNSAVPTPQLRIGTAIGRQITNVKRFTQVNGQSLLAPNASNLNGDNNIRFVYPDIIQTNDPKEDFTKRYAAADVLNIVGNAVDSAGIQPTVSLNGAYTVLSVSATTIVLSAPAAVNANWNALNAFGSHESTYGSPQLYTSGPRWIGPFLVNVNDANEIWCNFVAPNGLYKDDGKNQYAMSVDILVGIQAVDSTGTPIGSERFYTGTLNGESTVRNQRGITMENILPIAGPCQVRVQRTNATDTTFQGTIVDDVRWRDMYSSSLVLLNDFGDITTIQTAVYATEGALTIKSRKLNLIVTRKIKQLNPDGTLSGGLVAVSDAGSILVAMTTDAAIGNRPVAEIDTVQIAATITAINAYFASSRCSEFCYTFDDAKVSFEESVADVANAIFCTAYRRGNVIKLLFEKQTNNSVALYNHRNKLPKSETRTVTFGPVSEFDGVDYEYTNSNDPTFQNIDTRETLHFPLDGSARNPKKVQSVGVRNVIQAWLQGWRLYNKIRFQNTTVQFVATQEAALRVLNERILVADNTRSDTQDGEVLAQNSLELTLSQEVTMLSTTEFSNEIDSYTIFLYLEDDTVEAIQCSLSNPVNNKSNKIILATAPSQPLSTDGSNYARTSYSIVKDVSGRPSAFLLAEKAAKDSMTFEMKAINYDDRYYVHDTDAQFGIIQENAIVPPNYPAGYAAGGGYPGPSGTAPTGGGYSGPGGYTSGGTGSDGTIHGASL